MTLTLALIIFVIAVNGLVDGYVLGGSNWMLPNKPTEGNSNNNNNNSGKDQPSQGSGIAIGLGTGGSSGNLDLLHVLGGLNVAQSMNTNNLLNTIVGNLAAQSLAGGRAGQDQGHDGELLGLLNKLVQKEGQGQVQGGNTNETKVPQKLKGMIEMMQLEKLYDALHILGTMKEKEAEIKMAIGYLCLAVKTVYRFAEMHNASVYNGTDVEMKQGRPEADKMTEEDKLAYMLHMLSTNMPKFNQAFLFLADWTCQAAGEYELAAGAVKKMEEEINATEDSAN